MTLRSLLNALRSTAQRLPSHTSGRRLKFSPRFEALEDRNLLNASPVASLPMGPPRLADSMADIYAHEQRELGASDFDATRILVRFNQEAGDVSNLRVAAGTTIGRELPLVPGLREVRLAPGIGVEQALAAYRANPLVQYAQPNYRVHAQTNPNDPGFGSLWGMHNSGQTGGTPDADIDAPEAWDHWTGNGSTVVAVLDTGVDYTHPDLAANLWTNAGEVNGDGLDNDGNGIVDDYYGANFVYRDENFNPTGDVFDDFFHGTHVSGTLGAVGNNGVGVAGVSWNVRIMTIKFLDAWGYGYTSDAIDGLNYAVSMGAMISNNSWGGGPYDQGLYDAIQSAGQLGHVFVAAAGNWGVDADWDPMYPAAYDLDNIISVAATDHNDQLAYFSNYGASSVDLSAPGVDVYSTLPTYLTEAMWEYGLGTEYGWLSGTSMATPHVAGAAALLRDLYPAWSAQQVKDRLLDTVDPLAGLEGFTVTGGRLNAASALTGTAVPRLRINDATILEENSGGVLATFTVTLSAPSNETVTVAYATAASTATAGSDYASTSGTLTFGPGEVSKDVTVSVLGDRLAEFTEAFFVNLSTPTNANIADGQGLGTITDNEPRISISDVTLAEGANKRTTLFNFTVTLSAAYDQPVTVLFRTADGTARAGQDYVARTGALTFLPNQTSLTVSVEVKGENKREPNETFFVDLFAASANALLSKSRGLGTILNDD
jgi:subtilisin family serine protease